MSTDMIRTDAATTTATEERKDGDKMTMTVEQMAEAAKKLRDACRELDSQLLNCVFRELLYHIGEADCCRIEGVGTMVSICRDFDCAYNEYYGCNPDDDKYNDVVINLIKSSAEVASGSYETCDRLVRDVFRYVDDNVSSGSDEHDADYAKWYDRDLYMDWINDNLDPNVDVYRKTLHYPRVKKHLIHDCHGIDMDDYRTYCSDNYDGCLPSDIEEKCKTAKDVYDNVIDDLYYHYKWLPKDVYDAYNLRDELSSVIYRISDNGNNRWWEDVYEQYKSH